MKLFSLAVLALASFALPAGRASAAMPDWSPETTPELRHAIDGLDLQGMPDFVKVRAARRARRSAALRKPRRTPQTHAAKPVFVADEATWARLVARGKRSPDIEVVTLAGVDYRFHVLDTSQPVSGQKCAAGTVVDNTLYVYDGLPQAPGAELYPVRLSAECVNDLGAPDALSVDAEVDGKILNTDWIHAPSTNASHPTFEGGSDRVFLNGLVSLFISLP